MSRRLEYSEERLNSSDLQEICSKLWEARIKWFNIGLGLNLEVSDLEAIRQTNRDNVDDCFREMLQKWLRTSQRPTQSNLITVLRERNVGFNQLAEELENKSFKRDRVKMASTNVMMKTSLALKNKSVIKFGVPTLIVTVILFIALRFSPNSKDRFTVIKTISGLENSCGVAVNQRGEIIVAEMGGHYISMFSSTGEKLRSFGSKGSGPGQFSHPRGVAVDNDGNILVVDSNNNRIQKFTSDHKHITSVGGQGSNRLQFSHPISVSISPITKEIVVSDYFNHRVQILNPDLTFSSSIGSEGSGNGEFSYPHDVAFDSADNMYVVDAGNNRIQVFNQKEEYLWQFGKRGNSNGELDDPTSIYIDSDNIVYVTEAINHRVSLFTLEGEFLTSFGSEGDGPGQFNHPCGITMDKQGAIHVADYDNNRIQIFAKPIKSPHKTS